MYYLAEFNKLLNIPKHFRTLKSGKKVPVRGYRRTVSRLRAALTDLRKQGGLKKEGLYLLDPKTGLVSKRVSGKESRVSTLGLLNENKRRASDEVLAEKFGKRWFLHNHPGRTSLSPGDFLGRSRPTDQVFVTTTSGSVMRGRSTPRFDNLTKKQYNKIKSDQIFLINSLKKRLPNTTLDERTFLVTHLTNKRLAEDGLVKYRSYLSKSDKKLVDKYKRVVTDSINNVDVLREFDKELAANIVKQRKARRGALNSSELRNLVSQLERKKSTGKPIRSSVNKIIKQLNMSSGESLSKQLEKDNMYQIFKTFGDKDKMRMRRNQLKEQKRKRIKRIQDEFKGLRELNLY